MDITLEDVTPRTLIRKVSHRLPVSSTPLANFVQPKPPPASKRRICRKSSLGLRSTDDTPRTMIMKVSKEKAARRSSVFKLEEKNLMHKKVSGKFRQKSQKHCAEIEDSSAEDETLVDRSLSSSGLQKKLEKNIGPKSKTRQLTLEQFASGVERLKRHRDDQKEAMKYHLSSDAVSEITEEATDGTIIVPVDDLLASSPLSFHSSLRTNSRLSSAASTIPLSPLLSSEPPNTDDLLALPEIYVKTPNRTVQKIIYSSDSIETLPIDDQEHSRKQQPLETTGKLNSRDDVRNKENVSSIITTRQSHRRSLPGSKKEKDLTLPITRQTRKSLPLVSVRAKDISLDSHRLSSSTLVDSRNSQHTNEESSAQGQKTVTGRRQSSRLSFLNEKSITVRRPDSKNGRSLRYDADQFPVVQSPSVSKEQSSVPQQDQEPAFASEKETTYRTRSRQSQKASENRNKLQLDASYRTDFNASKETVSRPSNISSKSAISDHSNAEEFPVHQEEESSSYRLYLRSRISIAGRPVVADDASFKLRSNVESQKVKKLSTVENSSQEKNQPLNSYALLSSEMSATTDFAVSNNAPVNYQSSPLPDTEKTFQAIQKNSNLMQVSSIRAIDETSKSQKLPDISESQDMTTAKSRKRKSIKIDSETEDKIPALPADFAQKRTSIGKATSEMIKAQDEHVADVESITEEPPVDMAQDEHHIADVESIAEEPPVDMAQDNMVGIKSGPLVSLNISSESWHDLESSSSENPESDEESAAVEREKSIPVLSSPIQSYATPKNVQEPPRSAAEVERPVVRRRPRKPKSSKPQMPVSLTRKLFRRFSNMPLSSNALEILDDCCDIFWENAIASLEAYANHGGRRSIDVSDVELLLFRQGFAKDRNSLNALKEKYLPLELRSLLIPMATAENIVIP